MFSSQKALLLPSNAPQKVTLDRRASGQSEPTPLTSSDRLRDAGRNPYTSRGPVPWSLGIDSRMKHRRKLSESLSHGETALP